MNWEELIRQTGVAEWALMGLFLGSLLYQSGLYLFLYRRLPGYAPPKKRQTKKPLSVIICARNEEENLKKFLPRVLEQDYPDFEVVVVNDASTDQTENLLAEMSVRYSRLRYTNLPVSERFSRGKKLALAIGLKAAKYDHVVLTDADCYPVTDQWLRQMAYRLTGDTKIVLGYGGYERRKGLLNLIIRYETVFTAMQYFSRALAGRPYMGVGRNLAYHSELFFKNKGFAGHYHLASGDDDLFVNQHATGQNTAVVTDREAHTRSVPEASLRGWIKQKQRHLSAGTHYKRDSRVRLGLELATRMVLYITLVILSVISPWRIFILGLFLLGLIARLVVLKMAMRSLDEKYLLLPSLLLDPALPLVLGIIWFSRIFVTKYQPWK
ncbi:MAG: glycosyltransferase [Bacteroidales bacterium]